MMHAIQEILSQGFMITGFVMIMMLVIEYLNVLTRGNWDRIIAKWGIRQSILCSFLGATPGCLGAYAVGSLYIHRVVGIGALTAAMVATCGDEAFIMLALFPKTALIIFAALFAGGILSGIAVSLIAKDSPAPIAPHIQERDSAHPEDPRCTPFSTHEFFSQWRNCSPQRGWLTFFLAIFLGGIASGTIGHEHEPLIPSEAPGSAIEQQHDHGAHGAHHGEAEGEQHEDAWSWVRITLFALGLVALIIVATVPDHFLDEHLWHHLVKVHGWRVLLWTLGALAITHVLTNGVDITELVSDHKLPILLTACLVGVLPSSGPHLIFITLYSEQAIPLSVLVANCIIQDGHGLIPTLAHSRRAFFGIKAFKFAVGLAIGLIGNAMGW
jgi:hypothetical protein